MDVQMPTGVVMTAQPARPSYAVAYVFNADPALPIFEAMRQAAPLLPQAIEAQADSRHETPEPLPPAPLPPAPAPEDPEPPQPHEGAAAAAQDGEQPARQPLPRGEAERRALAYLAAHPEDTLTPGQIAKAIDARGCRDLMARLYARGAVDRVGTKPVAYRALRDQ